MNNSNTKAQNAQPASNQDFSESYHNSREWQRHNHQNPCPVCGEAKKGCRTNTETNIIHCRGANPSPDYRFLKEDKHGFWMYKLESEIEAFTQEQKEQWLEEKRIERENKKRQWEDQLKKQLSEKERDKAIREILNQLSLSDEHKEKLHQRGLSDKQIKNAGYRSVSQWQKLEKSVSPALAGVNRYGNGLVTPDIGILIPIPNEKGLWVGYQVRRDNPDDGNKYLWSASEHKREPRPTIHNQYGELPLGVWGKPSDGGVVGLCESTGIKPYIASLRLGIPFIGASGANFASSPNALTNALTALQAKKIIIYPDAGAIANCHIHQQLTNTANFLLDHGYDVQFAWWGQTEKTAGDIDEILKEKIRSIEHLKLSEYQQMAQQQVQMIKPSGKGVQSEFHSEENLFKTDKPQRLNKKKLLAFIRKLKPRFNELTREIEIEGKALEFEPYLYLLDNYNIDCGKDTATDMMLMVAKQNSYNPVKEYLESLERIAPINISNLASRYFSTNSPLYDIFIEKMLIGAVARAYEAGCKLDTALILQGKQGIGKSSFFDVLGGDYFDDSMGNGSDKDDLLTLYRSWIQEWGELDRIFGKKMAGEVKQFLSKRRDTFREPYARKTETFNRHSIIVGSVNDSQFLNDPTGDRRFWVIPIETDEIDIEQLKRERDAIWSAAVEAYKSGKSWWLTNQEQTESAENNQQFRTRDEWEEIIIDWLGSREITTIKEILINCFNYEPKNLDKSSQNRIANCLKSMGWEKTRKTYQGKQQSVWISTASTASTPLNDEVCYSETQSQTSISTARSASTAFSKTLINNQDEQDKPEDNLSMLDESIKDSEEADLADLREPKTFSQTASEQLDHPQNQGELADLPDLPKSSDVTSHLISGNKILYRDWINKENKEDILISPKNERGKIQLENAQIDSFQIRKIWDKEGNLLWEKNK